MKTFIKRFSLNNKNIVNQTGATLGVMLTTVSLCPTPAQAQDYIYGGDARAFAMGGAGIALMQNRSSRANPASLAFENKVADPTFPTLGFRTTDGISKDSAGGFLVGGLKNQDAAVLARDFGSQDSEFGVTAAVGFRYGNVEIGASAIGQGRLQPNAPLQIWSQTARDRLQALPDDARGDVFAAGYYNLPTVSIGQKVPTPHLVSHQVGVGVRLKYMNAVYTHYIAEQRAILGLEDARLAPEMNGQNRLEKRGLGVDLGVMIRPRKDRGFSGAVVVANAVKPNFSFQGTDRNGNPTHIDLLRTTLSAGVGYRSGYGTVVALDAMDIAGAAGAAQLRAGIEQRVWGPIYLRGGYNSQTGTTYGASFFGVDIAIGNRIPLEVTRTFSF